MKKVLCAAQDRKSEQFGPIQLFFNDADAIRSFVDAVNHEDAQNMLYMHPDDYDYWRIGTYETDDGVITVENHRRLITGNEAKNVVDKSLKVVK